MSTIDKILEIINDGLGETCPSITLAFGECVRPIHDDETPCRNAGGEEWFTWQLYC